MENNIKKIDGNWDAGFVLDKHTRHSDFLGYDANGKPQFDTKRSEVGEALYQLKYRSDFSRVESLAAEVATHLVPRFEKIDMVIPMPATNQRNRQPVTEIARALSARLMVPMFDNLLTKLPPPEEGAPQLKDLLGKDAKVAALSGRFQLNPIISNEGRWNALLVDDLYDTGATMEAATTQLREYAKIGRIFVAALTWK